MNLMELVKNRKTNDETVEYLNDVHDRFMQFSETERIEITKIAVDRFCGLDRAMMIFDFLG